MAKRIEPVQGASRRRPRVLAFVVAAVVVVGVVAGIALSTRGSSGDTLAGLAPNLPRCNVRSPRTALCPHNAPFDAKGYTIHGDAYDCVDFASQADAQAVLRQDPQDPDDLDPDHDGIACPLLGDPRDTTLVKARLAGFKCPPVHTRNPLIRALGTDMRSARCPQRARRFDPGFYFQGAVDGWDCSQFASQADAQAVLRYGPSDPNKLDGDGDGIACPGLPAPKDLTPVTTRPPS